MILFYAEKMEKMKQLVSVIGAKKNAPTWCRIKLMRLKLQQVVGELLFAANHDIAS